MPARILVIEDNLTNLELVTYLLTAAGHSALTARDGDVGVETACRELPDLIICDVHLPRVDGYQVVQLLRRQSALHLVPVVAVTALAMVGDREKVLAGGFDGYIAKPIVPETFVAQVEAFLPDAQRSSVRLFAARSPRSVAPAAPVAPHPAGPAPATVLVLDNVSVNRELMESLLQPFHYTVLSAKTVDEALAQARRSPPDVIISDVHLPERDGFDFFHALKADPQLRSVPFVFVSSSMEAERVRAAALALGADRFILRPIDPQALLAEIAACLRAHGNQRGGGQEPNGDTTQEPGSVADAGAG